MVTRGEVWWVERPSGRRPHLVLTRQAAIPVLHSVLAVPATRTIRGIPTEVKLGPEDGMPAHCVLTLDNVVTVRQAYFVDRITRLRPDKMDEVCATLAIAAGCG